MIKNKGVSCNLKELSAIIHTFKGYSNTPLSLTAIVRESNVYNDRVKEALTFLIRFKFVDKIKYKGMSFYLYPSKRLI